MREISILDIEVNYGGVIPCTTKEKNGDVRFKKSLLSANPSEWLQLVVDDSLIVPLYSILVSIMFAHPVKANWPYQLQR